MQHLNFLNSKAKREVVDSLKESYGFSGELPGHLMISGKDKIFLLGDSDIVRNGQDRQLRIDRAGLKIGTKTLSGIRLNIEGSQIIGPNAKSNILEIIPDHLGNLVRGEDFLLEEEEKRQVGDAKGLFILRNGKDFLGSHLIKDGKLLNQLSKNRKVKHLND